jgi:hypothetical protein
MEQLLLLTIITITVSIYGCSAITISFNDQAMQLLKDPKLLFAFDYICEGFSLGMIGLEIRFDKTDYKKNNNLIIIRGKVIDETTKEPVFPVKVYIAQKLNYDANLKAYNIILSDSIQAEKDGRFEIRTSLQKNTIIISKAIGFYGRVYNIGELDK